MPRLRGAVAIVASAFIILLGVVLPISGQTSPADSLPDEYIVKAADLYALGLNVEWPKAALEAAGDKFLIGIVGRDDFADALDFIARKRKIQGRTIVIRRFPSLEQYQPGCQIVFISRSLTPEQQLAAIRKISGVGVLLVGESPDFAKEGGIINFYLEGNRVRFEINNEAARRARLHLDAKLLNIATPVTAGSREPKDAGRGPSANPRLSIFDVRSPSR
ncbi:MAG: YfiR family protein [Pirellulales bacterium]|nr:YfiR family protein [Pirellulales bacterium]